MLIFRNRITTFRAGFLLATAKAKKEKNHYQILELPSNATPTTIRKNYIKLAKLYHPDVYKGADRNRFQRIQEAYKVLSNQSDRNRYD
jgi:molecular chaperone DnaJ